MLYIVMLSEKVDSKFTRIRKKNKKLLDIINKKVKQIITNPFHFKPLHGDMHRVRRVHIAKSFVLTYEIDEKNRIIKILDFDHHDNIYN